MNTAPRPNEGTAPTWKSWLVLLSLLTDPKYVAYRLRRRWARLRGQPAPVPLPGPARPDTADLSSLDVDLVYLWVSGQDPKHAELRNYWLEQYGLPRRVFNPDIRYVEDDELRYSLRSVEAFVPWARKMHGGGSPAAVFGVQAPISTAVWSNRAGAICEAMKRCQIRR